MGEDCPSLSLPLRPKLAATGFAGSAQSHWLSYLSHRDAVRIKCTSFFFSSVVDTSWLVVRSSGGSGRVATEEEACVCASPVARFCLVAVANGSNRGREQEMVALFSPGDWRGHWWHCCCCCSSPLTPL